MRNIAIWHCYDYGPNHTFVMVAETEDALRAKVRGAIAEIWNEADQGPMPEDWDELLEAYDNQCGSYIGDWGYTVIDSTLCAPVEDDV